MIRHRGTRCWTALVAGLLISSFTANFALAQGIRTAPPPRDFRAQDPRDIRDRDRDIRDVRDIRDQRDYRDPRDIRTAGVPIIPVTAASTGISSNISGATAVLESVVRTMYSHIEPGRENSPNELLAYADLRVLRLYVGAMEVSGWSLEQSYADFLNYRQQGHYRDGYSHISDRKAQAAWERYRAYRETVRTLLLRVRTTAVSVEHQVSFCDPIVGQEWRDEVLPALRDTIAAVEPLLIDEVRPSRYSAYGPVGRPTTASTTVIPTSTSGIPQNAVEVGPRFATHMPYEGRGHGEGRYFEVRAYGGQIRIRNIRFTSYDRATGSNLTRELTVDSSVEPGRPLFVSCHRGRWVDASNVEITWESADRGRGRVYGSIDLVDGSPSDPAPRR